jgi:hypothetical protein
MVEIAFFYSAASLATSSCLQNLYDLLIIRGTLMKSLCILHLESRSGSYQESRPLGALELCTYIYLTEN